MTYMLMTENELNIAIKSFFISASEEADQKNEFIVRMTVHDLPDIDKANGVPEYFSESNYLINNFKTTDELFMNSIV